VTVASDGITGSAELTIERRMATDGKIPTDFTVASAIRTLYDNFDGETKSSLRY
jgi:hypothetical protein